MKRDMELVREILVAIEECEDGYAPADFRGRPWRDATIGYHVYLMGQADLLQVADSSSFGQDSPNALPVCLTWQGHEFIDAARSPVVWKRAKERVASTVGSVAIGVFVTLLTQIAREQLGIAP